MTVSSVDLSAYTAPLRASIEAALFRYTEFDGDCPDRLRAAIRHSLLAPGKRLRPMLVLMAADACGCDPQVAVPAACAVEMIHTYSLIHDDLPAMDDDDIRRGRPSCHAAFDEATAILAGDALLARAFEVIATDIPSPAIAARCIAELANAAGATALVGGQADDLAAEFSGAGMDELERIHRRKTGAMFRVSLRLGGIIGEASQPQLDALDTYGNCLGLAFQITDDLLDVKGDAAAMGKRVAKDTGRGKLTFPTLLGIDGSHQRARQLIVDACQAVTCFGSRANPLDSLAQYVLERNR
jgi:geranylgeranyl diphosphate synthase type II